MNRIRQRCLAVSVMVHVSLVLLLVFSPGFSSPEQPLPIMELVPTMMTLTDDAKLSGGVEEPQPPKATPKPGGSPALPVVKPPEPAVPVVKDPPKAERETPVRELKTHTPVDPSPTEPLKTKDKEVPAELKSHEPVEEKAPPDPTGTEKPEKPVKSVPRGKKTIEINTEIKRRTNDDDSAAEIAREKAVREAQQREHQEAVNRFNDERRRLAQNLGNAADTLSKGTGTATDIQMPGTGGEVFADYRVYIAAFYKQKWDQNRPGGISVKSASVLTSVTIGRDGHVRSTKVLAGSGISDIDKMVRQVLQRYDQLKPFPASSTDDERTFTLTFRVQSDSNP